MIAPSMNLSARLTDPTVGGGSVTFRSHPAAMLGGSVLVIGSSSGCGAPTFSHR
jgi:hypothetical protein